ncbi:hypothetical protein NL108_018241 [Boleophthalmus pectinirostris]|nr:hypothetical protein NL108_018241 [Boleophthalmus pectinirostris]
MLLPPQKTDLELCFLHTCLSVYISKSQNALFHLVMSRSGRFQVNSSFYLLSSRERKLSLNLQGLCVKRVNETNTTPDLFVRKLHLNIGQKIDLMSCRNMETRLIISLQIF